MEKDSVAVSKMIEVRLPSEDAFLIVKETLTRIGIASSKSKTLTQTCHILHKRGRYYITHFKLLFELDGKSSNYDDIDRQRMVLISNLLESWNLLETIQSHNCDLNISSLKIIQTSEKKNWKLVSKHRIGK